MLIVFFTSCNMQLRECAWLCLVAATCATQLHLVHIKLQMQSWHQHSAPTLMLCLFSAHLPPPNWRLLCRPVFAHSALQLSINRVTHIMWLCSCAANQHHFNHSVAAIALQACFCLQRASDSLCSSLPFNHRLCSRRTHVDRHKSTRSIWLGCLKAVCTSGGLPRCGSWRGGAPGV